MKKSFLYPVILCTAIFFNSLAWGDTEKAEFSIHLFQDGLPIADAELTISSMTYERTDAQLIEATPSLLTWRVEDQPFLKTNANGSIAAKLPSGKYHFKLKTSDQTFAFDLPLHTAENVQILVTFYSDGKEPLLNIESSVAGTIAGSEAPGEKPPAEGDGVMIVKVLSVETKKPIKDVQIFVSGLKTTAQNR